MSRKGADRRKLPGDGVVTLKDFADASTSGGKAKKAVTSRRIGEILDDDEILDDPENPLKPRRRRNKREQEEDPNHVYYDLHIDIWFLIAEHIHPEDVGRFALICTKTENVVASARFWFTLYRRYYNSKIELPERFKPDCMVRLSCLRSNVVRSLFYTYPPFVQRLRTASTLSNLENLRFLNCWYKEESKVWIFCYKFWNRLKVRKPRPHKPIDEDDEDDAFEQVLAQLNNIFENPNEGKSLLVIFTKRFIPFPHLAGQDMYIRSLRQMLTQDMRTENLELEFSEPREDDLVTRVVYPSILKYKVFHWWHPDYYVFS